MGDTREAVLPGEQRSAPECSRHSFSLGVPLLIRPVWELNESDSLRRRAKSADTVSPSALCVPQGQPLRAVAAADYHWKVWLQVSPEKTRHCRLQKHDWSAEWISRPCPTLSSSQKQGGKVNL